MKYYPRLGIYKSSNVSFDPKTLDARSYGYWRFVMPIGKKIYFNNYRYSKSTIRHQYKVECLLQKLGIKINETLETRRGFQSNAWYESSIEIYTNKINKLKSEIAKPRSHKAKNKERMKMIKNYQAKLNLVTKLYNQWKASV